MKKIELPLAIYVDLTTISRELSVIAKKPVSLSMATSLLISVYRAHMSEPCARDAFRQRLANSPIVSPEEFDEAADIPTQ